MISEPAIGKAFFGRQGILGLLDKRVNALKAGYRQNVALTGHMLSGKSSILSQFLHELKDASLVPVYVEVVDEPFASFADKFIATLLYNYLLSTGGEATKDLHGLIRMSEERIPHTARAAGKVLAELSGKNHTDAYRKLLNLTSLIKKETGKSCIVILDEFHNLESIKIKKPYLHFGKIMMIQKDTMYIVSSSRKNTIKRILSEKLALLYGNFEIVEVSGFNADTAKAFLEEKLQNINLPRGLADYLIDFTDGNPFYLDVISRKIAEIANARKLASVEEDTLTQAFTSLIYNTSGTINQYFTNNIMALFERALRKDYMNILIALALGSNKLRDIAARLGKKSTNDISAKITRLIELDMVYKNGVFYEVQDSVFKFWLGAVYHKKKTSLLDDIVAGTSEFKEDLKKDLAEYQAQSREPIQERIKKLFSSFAGEMVEIEKRTRRLPEFIKIENVKYGAREGLVTHQNENRYWVCEIFRSRIDETAVTDFIERRHPAGDRAAKKICVALDDIDANALLLAKEKNIWVWSLDNINALLRLYKGRRLICR